MQRLIIAGNVGKDAELRTAPSGDQALNWSIAVSNGKDRDGQDRPATWYDAALWGKRAEALAPHIRKGDRMTLIGRPSVRVHEGKAYLGISVDDLTLMGSAQPRDSNSDTRPRPDRDDPRTGGGRPGGYGDDYGDEIPFAPCM